MTLIVYAPPADPSVPDDEGFCTGWTPPDEGALVAVTTGVGVGAMVPLSEGR